MKNMRRHKIAQQKQRFRRYLAAALLLYFEVFSCLWMILRHVGGGTDIFYRESVYLSVALCGSNRKFVATFVFRMPGMTLYPDECDLVL